MNFYALTGFWLFDRKFTLVHSITDDVNHKFLFTIEAYTLYICQV